MTDLSAHRDELPVSSNLVTTPQDYGGLIEYSKSKFLCILCPPRIRLEVRVSAHIYDYIKGIVFCEAYWPKSAP